MDDKEVGELWREIRQIKDEFWTTPPRDMIIDLVHKLVEERKHAWLAIPDEDHNEDEAELLALRDFGIKPEEFNAKLNG